MSTTTYYNKLRSHGQNGEIYISVCNSSAVLFPKEVSPNDWKACNDAGDFTWTKDFNDDIVALTNLNKVKLSKSTGFCPQNRCQLYDLGNAVVDSYCPDSLCYTKVEKGALSSGACCFQNGKFNYGHLIGYHNKTTFTPKPIYKKSRIVLGDVDGGADESYDAFINANRVHQGLIATQCPMHNTIDDVKRMIVEQNITMWVQLAPYSLTSDPLQSQFDGSDLKTDCAVFPNVYLAPNLTGHHDFSSGVSDLRYVDISEIGLKVSVAAEERPPFVVQRFTLRYFRKVENGRTFISFDDPNSTNKTASHTAHRSSTTPISEKMNGSNLNAVKHSSRNKAGNLRVEIDSSDSSPSISPDDSAVSYSDSAESDAKGHEDDIINVESAESSEIIGSSSASSPVARWFPSTSTHHLHSDAAISNTSGGVNSGRWAAQSVEVEHVWYSRWEDFKVPVRDDQQNLMVLAKRAAAVIRSGVNTVAVSCQSGRGRTGTFSALVIADLHSTRSHDDLVDIVVGMREHRDGLVETPAQFRFVTETLGLPSSGQCDSLCRYSMLADGQVNAWAIYLAVVSGCVLVFIPVLYFVKKRFVKRKK